MQAALTRIYERAGRAYLLAVVTGGCVVALGLTAVGYLLLARYLDGSRHETWEVVAVGLAASFAALVVGLLASLDVFRPVQRWISGPRSSVHAAAAWEVVRDAGFVIVQRTAVVLWIATTPVLIWAAIGLDARWEVAPAAVGLGWATVATGWVVEMFLIDVAAKPIVRDVACYLIEERSEPTTRRRHLRTKVLVTVPTTAFLGAYLTGSFILDVSTPGARLYTVLGATAAVTLLFTGPVVAIAAGSILDPMRDLIAATRRVAQGDFSSRVPELTNDEFGDLARSFNRMQQGLREREALHAAVGSYIDPAIAERVMAEGSHIAGEAAAVTVMFVDIVGFTALAEGAEPAAVVSRLNDFFDVVIPAIERNGGHANKLLGDGLMAVFGVPRPLLDHSDRAFAAADEIASAIRDRYRGELRVGIGLNSGTVVVGSMGGGGKLDYTIIGDVVNVAARVEAQTRQTGDAILLTKATHSSFTRGGREFESRGTVALRGRRTGVELYAPSSHSTPLVRHRGM